MREQFRGYYPPTDAELDELWSRGTIVLDTNVLLNLYKYRADACEEMLAVLGAVRGRLWIPHQVALEYHRSREAVIGTQIAVFEKVKDILGSARIKARLEALQLRRFHSLISVDGVLSEIQPVLERFEHELAVLEDKHVKPTGSDTIRDRLETLLGSNIGLPLSPSELEEIYRDGETRYARNVPPGFADSKDKSKLPDYVHEGTAYSPKFGDLILWNQILRFAANKKTSHLMFISDDEKSDWRRELEHRGGRQLLPRPELVEEIRRTSGVEVFTIYSADSFLHVAKARLGVTVADSTISQVTEVKEAARLNDVPRAKLLYLTEHMPLDEQLCFLNVVGEEGNRRDAILHCGFCGDQDIPLHFYENDGRPQLSEILGFFHYWQCPKYTKGSPVHLFVHGEGRAPSLFTWTPLPHQR